MSDGGVRWKGPARPGSPVAAEATQFVAAPLLAGAAVATIGVVGADGPQFRWPGPAMLALTIAAASLLMGIQYALRGRHYLYSKGDVEQWHGELGNDRRAQQLAQWHGDDFHLWQQTNRRSVVAYQTGLGMLLFGLMGLVAPPDHASLAHAICRWCAVGVVGWALVWHALFAVQELRHSRLDSVRAHLLPPEGL